MKKPLVWLVILANLAGAAYGVIFYYGARLASTNPALWLFIADCPLYALLFAVALALALADKHHGLFYFLVSVGALKYGFWTLFVISAFPDFYFSAGATFLYSALFLAHIGMMAEPVLLLGKFKPKKYFVAVSLFWFLLNDFADYFFALHPPLPGSGLAFMFFATVAMSVFFIAFAYLVFSRLHAPKVLSI